MFCLDSVRPTRVLPMLIQREASEFLLFAGAQAPREYSLSEQSAPLRSHHSLTAPAEITLGKKKNTTLKMICTIDIV